jgi:DHA1 family inner membrane transport protein
VRLPLFALAVGTFAVGTTEFVIVGLLPEISSNLSVSLSTAGLLVSGYALGVTIGAPILTSLGAGLPRKHMLMLMMGVFVIGNLIAALAGSFGLLLAGRITSSVTHGAFFGVGAVVAAEMVDPTRRRHAVALMFTGLTAATILGVPLGTALGHAFGWRSTFWVVAAIGLAACGSIAALVPFEPAPPRIDLRHELGAFRAPGMWLLLTASALTSAALFSTLTYLSPLLTKVAGVSSGAVTWILVLFGAGLFSGNYLGARFGGHSLRRSLYGALLTMASALTLFALLASSAVAAALAVFVVGFAAFAAFAPSQVLIMEHARAAPTIASAVNIGAANLGNACGALIAGAIVGAGASYRLLPAAGSVLAVLALAVAALSARFAGVADVAEAEAPIVARIGPGG